MSINVTVKGNPVKIRHGKMVTTSADSAKNEFDKRRRIRLEQVREQSKEIARGVRDRVRKEQDKQLSRIENEGATKLKQWQNKKLLQLQEQYNECLKDIGLGHLQAEKENELIEANETDKRINKQLAKERGLKAAHVLQYEKNKKSLDKAKPNQQRNLARDVENSRAAMVSKISKKQKKNYRQTDSESENTDAEQYDKTIYSSDSDELILNISSSTDSSSLQLASKKTKEKTPKAKKAPKKIAESVSPPTGLSELEIDNKNTAQNQQRLSASTQTREEQIITETYKTINPDSYKSDYPMDTRISDRIRNRKIIPDQPCCQKKFYCPETKFSSAKSIQAGISEKLPSTKASEAQSKVNFIENERLDSNSQRPPPCYCNKNEIPYQPDVYLKPIAEESDTLGSKEKVQSYDYSTRFSKEFVPDGSTVQKIPESSVEVSQVSKRDDTNRRQQMFQRDKDAIVRGNKALEKEKIQKDYKDLMKKLPVLKKQENIAQIGKPTSYHMSEERIQQRERQRQNQMSNVYEREFPRSSEITLPKVSQGAPPNARTIPYGPSIPQWDVVKSNTERSSQETELARLLEKLQEQREMLINEVENIPESNNLKKVLDELSAIEKLKKERSQGSKRKHDQSEQQESTSTSSEVQEKSKVRSPKKSGKKKKHKSSRYSSTEEERRKVPPKQYLILQNISTQTSPKVSVEKEIVSPPKLHTTPTETKKSENVENVITCHKPKKVICKCSPDRKSNKKEKEKEEVCEILIKITEDEKPDIKILSPKKKKNSEEVDSESIEVVGNVEDLQEEVIKEPPQLKDKIVQTSKEKQSIGTQYSTTKIQSNVAKSKTKPDAKPVYTNSKTELLTRLKKKHQFSEKHKPTSLGEHISAKALDPSSSTTYYSPPEIPQANQNVQKTKGTQQKQNLTQSTNSSVSTSNATRHLDPRLKVYIRKLLKMSPDRIGELSVTSTDVSTFTSSLFEENKTNPMNQLKNVMKFFNLNPQDISRILNESDRSDATQSSKISEYSTTGTQYFSQPSNDSEAVNETTMRERSAERPSQIYYRTVAQEDFFRQGMSQHEPETPILDHGATSNTVQNISDITNNTNLVSSTNNSPQDDARQISLQSYSAQNYANVMDKYGKIAESCYQRIQSLEKMINQIRQEKKILYDSAQSESDRENSVTAYKELPSHLGEKTASSTDDTEQENVTKELLRIDANLAEKLNKLKNLKDKPKSPISVPTEQSESQAEATQPGPSHDKEQVNVSIDKELLERYKDLLNPTKPDSPPKESTIGHVTTTETFVPFLIDIPKLPKFNGEVANVNNENAKGNGHRNKRPPPAKALIIAKRFNENISTVPHELSTIVEAESHLSSKIAPTDTSKHLTDFGTLSKIINDKSNDEPIAFQSLPLEYSKEEDKQKSSGSDGTKLELATASNSSSSSSNMSDILSELIKNAVKSAQTIPSPKKKMGVKKSKSSPTKTITPKSITDSSSKSEMETIETMLQTLGMGWAVTTLRKTQQALAHSSSTSSLDISIKKVDTSSTSEISLQGFLKKQVITKYSSSSDSEIINLMKEFGEISAIAATPSPTLTKHQRTSTPNQISTGKSKTHSKLEAMISGESDISSIKPNEENFATLAEDTADVSNTTNHK